MMRIFSVIVGSILVFGFGAYTVYRDWSDVKALVIALMEINGGTIIMTIIMLGYLFLLPSLVREALKDD